MNHLGDSERNGLRISSLIRVWGFYQGLWAGVHVSRASRNPLEQRRGPRGYSLEPGVLSAEMTSSGGLEYVHNGFGRSFSPGPSLDVICSGEITNSLSLTRRTYAICIIRHV